MPYLRDPATPRKPVTTVELARMRGEGEKIAMLTCYDASFAVLCDAAGVDTLLVGDSLGNVIQGEGSTVAVTLDDMVYHTGCVARGLRNFHARPFLLADMPFASYHESREQAIRAASKLMAVGAQMVKLEGGEWVADTIRFMVERGIPVCAHVGLTPQTVHQLGGYRVQGRDAEGAARLKTDAACLEQAGASLVVLEMVPAALAAEVTEATCSMATIGIGAGPATHGQVLVLHDMLGVFPGRKPRFVRDFTLEGGRVQDALTRYVDAVKDGSFPAAEHCF
jgi:3-methyl-2-oxobutanoate hydroxymethyltransferase